MLRRTPNRDELEILTLTTAHFREQQHELLYPQRPRPGTRAAAVRGATIPAYVWAADPLAMWGAEWRDPLADKRLIELLLRFPLVAFLHGGRARGLARALGRGLLPEQIRLRTQRGAQSADYAVALSTALPGYRAVTRRMEGSAVCRELFNISSVTAALDRIQAGHLSPEVTSPIDRVIDAGLFLLEREGD